MAQNHSGSPLPELLSWLLDLFMSNAGEMKRDEVREGARRHWMALSAYPKEEIPPDTTPIEVPEPGNAKTAPQERDHPTVRRGRPPGSRNQVKFAPYSRRVA